MPLLLRFIAPLLVAILALLAPIGSQLVADDAKPATVLGRKIEAFELRDVQGQTYRLEEWKDRPAIVAVFLGTQCPLAQQYAPRLQSLAERFEAAGVTFLVINSNQQDSLADMNRFAKTYGLKIPLLKDAGNKVADQFGAERTPEAFVLDKQRTVVYRGRIDDQFTYGRQRPKVQHEYVAEALEALLADKPIAIAETAAHGCHIGRVLSPDETSEVTYSNQIVRIMQAKCVSCHRDGEIGPFPLTSYEETVGWAAMIREVVDTQRMPPWHANPEYGKFANDWRLSDGEKSQIDQWVEAGAPQGDLAQLPPPRTFSEGWQIGQPDAVFYIADEPYNVPAQGEVRYQYFTVDPKFTEDKWIQAAECRPDQRSVIHHIIVGLIPPNGSRKDVGGVHSEWLTATAPGGLPLVLRDGYAKLIPAGSKLVFQMHYTPNGKPHQDRSCVGLKFADPKTVKKQVGTEKAATNKFEIPPGDGNYAISARHHFDRDSQILAMFPHMHLRGKSFRYTLIYPDDRREILLDVPHYDFNWQIGYDLVEPKFVPAGSQMLCEATFDNSSNNIANPDPSKTVRWGDQTWEEMMIGYFDMAVADQDLSAANQRRTDQFLAQARAGNVSFAPEAKAKAAGALVSSEQLEAFGLELRKSLPQLDRVCWSTVAEGKLTINCVAQERATGRSISRANAGRQLDQGLSRLASLATAQQSGGSQDPTVYEVLGKQSAFDLQYMSRALESSAHVPCVIDGKPGTLNFWSTEKGAFPPESLALLQEVAKTLSK